MRISWLSKKPKATASGFFFVSRQIIAVGKMSLQISRHKSFPIMLHLKVKKRKGNLAKGQLISKAIYGVLDSPKKRTKKI